MADSFLNLEGNFDPAKNYMLKGSTLQSWQKALLADRVLPGENLIETQTPQGRIFTAQAGGGICPLGNISGGEIETGFISGGGAHIELEMENIVATANQFLYVRANWSVTLVDGALIGGGTMTSAGIFIGGSMPNDDIPTVNNSSGSAYIPLGLWDSDAVWKPAGCGSISLAFCPGMFKYVRG